MCEPLCSSYFNFIFFLLEARQEANLKCDVLEVGHMGLLCSYICTYSCLSVSLRRADIIIAAATLKQHISRSWRNGLLLY